MTPSLIVLVSTTASAALMMNPVNALGTFDGNVTARHVELSQVPPPARDAAQRELKGLNGAGVTDAILRDDDGQRVYEFEVDDPFGAAHIVRFTADGAPAMLGADE